MGWQWRGRARREGHSYAQGDWQPPAVHTNYIFNQLEGGCSINLPHTARESPWSRQEGPELMTPAQL